MYLKNSLFLSPFILYIALVLPNYPNAYASKPVRIVILEHLPRGVSDSKAGWLQRLFRWAIRKQPNLDVPPLDEVREKLFPSGGLSPKDKVALRVAKKLMKKVKILYQKKMFPYVLKAVKLVDKVLSKVKGMPPHELIRDKYLYTAATYLALRKAIETRDATLQTVAFDPEYEPDSAEFPTAFVTYYNAVKNWLLGQPKYTLILNTVPPGAKVYLNYRYKGDTPVKIEDIVQGKHLIRIEKQGFLPWERKANLTPQKLKNIRKVKVPNIYLNRDPNTLDIKLIPIYAKGADIDDNVLDKLAEICKRLNAQHLYVVSPRRFPSGNYYLRFAVFDLKKRKMTYQNLDVGSDRAQHRKKILTFAEKLDRKLGQSATPVVSQRETKISSTAVKPRSFESRYSPPPPVKRTPPPAVRTKIPPPKRTTPRIPPQHTPRERARPTPPPKERENYISPDDWEKKRPVKPTPPPAKPTASTPFYKSWWFWTLTAAGITAAAVTGVVLYVTSIPPDATIIITSSAAEN